MVRRSLKVIGAVLSLAAGAASALTVPSRSSGVGFAVWGSSAVMEDVRRIPATSVVEESSYTERDTLVMMPAGLEKAPVRTGAGPAVLDRPVVEKRNTKEPVKQKRWTGHAVWEVRIFNDGLNTREHVARCLVQVTGLSEIAAYQTMMLAHQTGMAVVGRWVYERAEMYHEALKKNGIICDLVPVEEDK